MKKFWWQSPAQAIDLSAQQAAEARQQQLTKPLGALGQLETIAIRLAGMQGKICPSIQTPWISIFAADHGVTVEGVSAYPSEVTAQMVANFSTGGAAICVLSRHIGAAFEVVDVGVASDTSVFRGVIQDKSQQGTDNFLVQAAMTSTALDIALNAGRSAVQRAIAMGADCFIGGEMGIGNTTSASALACAFLRATATDMTGAGTGISSTTLAHKIQVIDRALAHHQADKLANIDILATFGGYEIAALTGAYIAASQAGLPVIVDGFISSVAALAACKLNTSTHNWLFFGHMSAEQAHSKVLEALDGQPLLQLGMRLGEGSGAASAYGLLQLACALHSQMATFAEAQVSTSNA